MNSQIVLFFSPYVFALIIPVIVQIQCKKKKNDDEMTSLRVGTHSGMSTTGGSRISANDNKPHPRVSSKARVSKSRERTSMEKRSRGMNSGANQKMTAGEKSKMNADKKDEEKKSNGPKSKHHISNSPADEVKKGHHSDDKGKKSKEGTDGYDELDPVAGENQENSKMKNDDLQDKTQQNAVLSKQNAPQSKRKAHKDNKKDKIDRIAKGAKRESTDYPTMDDVGSDWDDAAGGKKENKPKVIPKNDKEKAIAGGKKVAHDDYPTLDNMKSDWDTEDQEAGKKKSNANVASKQQQQQSQLQKSIAKENKKTKSKSTVDEPPIY